MNSRNGILVAGTCVVDHIKMIDAWPQQDGLVTITSQTVNCGGSPPNVLIDLARLGADFPLQAAGLLGQDGNAAIIRDQLQAAGIDCRQLHAHPDLPTSHTDVMTVADSGRRTFFHCRGANAAFAPEHIDLAASQAKILLLGYLLLLDRFDAIGDDGRPVAASFLEDAQASGHLTVLDVVSEESDRFTRLITPCLPACDVCCINEVEAGRITGRVLRDGDDLLVDQLEPACRDLLAAGVGQLVVLHYPEGSFALPRDGDAIAIGSVALPRSAIVGAVGAGDAFMAGLLLGLHQERPLIDCLRLASVSAAACLSDSTSTGGMRDEAACAALAESHGWRAHPV